MLRLIGSNRACESPPAPDNDSACINGMSAGAKCAANEKCDHCEQGTSVWK